MLFALAVPVPGASFAQPKPQGSETPPASLAFTHVTVIDATGAAAQPDMTVVIAGDRIAALGRTNRVDLPQDARVVDAAGQFLIPGLWDMHAHIAIYASMKATRLPLLIANGVTGVRDLGALDDTVDDLRQWREEIAAGRLLGPRIVAAGPILDGREGGSEEFSIVTTAAEGRQAVVALAEQGFDFVKVYSWLTPEVYSAIVDEAGKQRLPFAGHVPRALTVAEASDAGQKSIEHLTGMLLAVSTRESELMREMAELPEPGTSNGFRASSRILAEAVESYSENKAGRLFKRLVENETWHCPTLVVLKSRVTRHDPTSRQDPRLRY
ncbi:MAG: amidohydrolase family protein, partial [Geminicoccales bacterium]